jgi:ABC-type transport system involved in cytochrome bd biosynthesis fused ATPase/permease subunit
MQRLAPLVRVSVPPRAQEDVELRQSLSLEDVTVDSVRGRKPRLRPLRLTLDARARVAVLGGSGDGKSTLLRCLAGAEPFSSGTVRFDGVAVNPQEERVLARVGYLPQDPVFPMSPVWRLLGLSGPEAITEPQLEALRSVGAWGVIDKLPKGLQQKVSSASLSRSETRTLSLGSLIIRDAALWLIDAAVEGMNDENAGIHVGAVLDRAGERTVLLSLRHAVELERFDRVLVLRRGKLRFDGTPQAWRAWKEAREAAKEPRIEERGPTLCKA